MYDREIRTLKEEKKLLVAEIKIMRKSSRSNPKSTWLYRHVEMGVNTWRVRKNLENKGLIAVPNILGQFKAQRLHWLGYVETMGDVEISKSPSRYATYHW